MMNTNAPEEERQSCFLPGVKFRSFDVPLITFTRYWLGANG